MDVTSLKYKLNIFVITGCRPIQESIPYRDPPDYDSADVSRTMLTV